MTYLGDQKSREIIREYECENDHGDLAFNVLITSYEMVWKDKTFFQDIVWSNVVVDEAQINALGIGFVAADIINQSDAVRHDPDKLALKSLERKPWRLRPLLVLLRLKYGAGSVRRHSRS